MEPLTVVIVTYHSAAYIERCLDSVRSATDPRLTQVIVVDNASRDGTAELLERRYPDVELIPLERNLGFAAGSNRARDKVRGELVCFLNPDVAVRRDTFERLCDYLGEHPDVGAVGPRLVREDGSTDPGCKRGFPTAWNALGHFTGLSRLVPGASPLAGYRRLDIPDGATSPVDCVSGAFLLARREALDTVGWFDEAYVLYGDDIDLCYRLVRQGYGVAYVGSAEALHTGGTSVLHNPKQATDEFFRSMTVFIEKHYRSRYPSIVLWLLRSGVTVLWAGRRLRLAVSALLSTGASAYGPPLTPVKAGEGRASTRPDPTPSS